MRQFDDKHPLELPVPASGSSTKNFFLPSSALVATRKNRSISATSVLA